MGWRCRCSRCWAATRMPAIGVRGDRATEYILRSEAGKPEGLILLETLVELGPAGDDFAHACLDGFGFERGDGDLPGRRLHQLRCGKNALADQLVDRPDADAEPGRGSVGADRLGAR